MFGWIGRIWNWGVTNVGDPVSSWVRDFVQGVFGWIHTLFGHIGEAWHQFFIVGVDLNHGIKALGHATWDSLHRLFYITIPRLIAWAGHQLARLGHDIATLTTWIARRVEQLVARIVHDIAVLTHWVVVHIFDPLKRDILSAWHWITSRGELVFYYITHPDKLAMLIFDSLIALLERTAWQVAPKLGKFFLSLVIHNLRRFTLLLEDIIMAVL
jgi:hypothetical protein